MHVRVVRFTGVDAERMSGLRDRVESSGGPPEGVRMRELKVLHDASRGTAVVLQFFDSAEDMEHSAKVFEAMDPSETPGTRASVDACEQVFERSVA